MEWINANESLPKLENNKILSVDVLCHLEDGEMIVTYYNYSQEKWILNNSKNIITHWMELPERPS